MGWSYGVVNGREVGYSVEATCDVEGCDAEIDRGLAYVCGSCHGGDEDGCGDYFCAEHLFHGGPVQLCGACCDRSEAPECETCGERSTSGVTNYGSGGESFTCTDCIPTNRVG